jgi:hypothetical protein
MLYLFLCDIEIEVNFHQIFTSNQKKFSKQKVTLVFFNLILPPSNVFKFDNNTDFSNEMK